MANIQASADQSLTTYGSLTALDLALMPSYRRRMIQKSSKAPLPSPEEIEAAWQSWHESFSGSQVYFVQRGYDPAAPIKIGCSKNPAKRIQTLQTSCAEPLVILARCDGSRGLEQEYHRRFAADLLKGEWFEASAAVLEEVARLRRSHNARAKFPSTIVGKTPNGPMKRANAAPGLSTNAAEMRNA